MEQFVQILLLSLMIPGVSHAELTRFLSIEGAYDDNAMRTARVDGDYATRVAADLTGRSAGNDAPTTVEGFYNGSLTFYKRLTDLNIQSHRVGMSYTRRTEGGRTLFSAGGSFAILMNQPRYSLYDDRVWKGYLGFQHSTEGRRTIRLGYTIASRIYPNAEAFSSIDQEVTTSVSETFPTRTSIRLDGNLGYRKYRSRNPTDYAGMPPGEGMMIGGMGRRIGSDSNLGMGDSRVFPWIETQTGTTTQAVAALRISQAITDVIGIGVRYLHRINPSIGTRLLQAPLFGDRIDDGLFNDRYTYSGPEVTGTLSIILPLDLDVTIEGGRLIRSYNSTSREDRRAIFSTHVEKTLPFVLPDGLIVDVEIGRYANNSTDPSFTYRTTMISLGFGAEF